MWMLTFTVALDYQGLLLREFLWFCEFFLGFFFQFFFSIRPTDPISANAFVAKQKKKQKTKKQKNKKEWPNVILV